MNTLKKLCIYIHLFSNNYRKSKYKKIKKKNTLLNNKIYSRTTKCTTSFCCKKPGEYIHWRR